MVLTLKFSYFALKVSAPITPEEIDMLSVPAAVRAALDWGEVEAGASNPGEIYSPRSALTCPSEAR